MCRAASGSHIHACFEARVQARERLRMKRRAELLQDEVYGLSDPSSTWPVIAHRE